MSCRNLRWCEGVPYSWSERARKRQLPSPRVSAAYRPRARSCCVSCCVFSVGSERSCDTSEVSESGDEGAYMGGRTRALEDLVVRERTDDGGRRRRACQRRPGVCHAYSLGCGPLAPAFCLLDEGMWGVVCLLGSRLCKADYRTRSPWLVEGSSGVRAHLGRSRDLCHPAYQLPYIIRA